MADQWFIARNNKKHGPFTTAKLKELAAKGRLLPTDMLHKDGMPKWVAASAVKGLVLGAASPTVPRADGDKFQFDAASDSPKSRRTQPSSRKRLVILGAAGGGVLLLALLVVVLVIATGKRSAPTVVGSASGSKASDNSSLGEKELLKTVADIHPKSVDCIAFSPDGKLLATAARSDGNVKLWHSLSGDTILTISATKGILDFVSDGGFDSIAFSPDGKRLACACSRTISVWSVATGERLLSFPHGDGSSNRESVAFSPDGKRIATGGYNRHVKLWDASTGQLLLDRKIGGNISRVAFSPDGKMLATCTMEAVILWDAPTVKDQLLALKPQPNEDFRDLAFSPDSKRIATIQRRSKDKQGMRVDNADLSVWMTASGKQVFSTPAHSYSPGSVLFSPNGKLILTATNRFSYSSSNPIFEAAVWSATNGDRVVSFTGHNGCIRSVAFHPDSKHIATASTDGTVKVWEATTGNELLILKSTEFRDSRPAVKPDAVATESRFDHRTNTKSALKKKIVEISYVNAVQPVTKTYEAMCKPQRFKDVIGNPDRGDTSTGKNKFWTYRCSDGEITFRVHVLGNSAIQIVKIERE